MKLYQTPIGTWTSTEEAWRDAMKAEGEDHTGAPAAVNVPTSKAELLEFLTFHGVNILYPERTTILSHVVQNITPDPAPCCYTERTMKIDEAFEALPLARQIHLAVTVFESIRARIPELGL